MDMPHPIDVGLFDEAELDGAIECRADADIDAGRLIAGRAVLHWLSLWSTAAPLLPIRTMR